METSSSRRYKAAVERERVHRSGFGWLFAAATLLAVLVAAANPAVAAWINSGLALESEKVTWFITRASGIVAYLLLWLSTAWGLALPTKLLDRFLHRSYAFEFHQLISLLALAFTGLHVVILLWDQYVPFTVAQLLVPFTSTYRPFWVGVGVIGMYLAVLVSVTFYIRHWIGMKAFRAIHLASLVAYLGAALHGLFSGTDSAQVFMQLMYGGTFLSVFFLFVFWRIRAGLDAALEASV